MEIGLKVQLYIINSFSCKGISGENNNIIPMIFLHQYDWNMKNMNKGLGFFVFVLKLCITMVLKFVSVKLIKVWKGSFGCFVGPV